MHKYKAVIFDFDGVLVESMNIKADAFIYVFRDHPEIKDRIYELHMSRGGMSRWEKFRIICEDYLGMPLTEDIKKRLSAEFAEFVFDAVCAAPYVKGAVEFLNNHSNDYLFFIVSGTPHGEINEIVKKRGLAPFFREVLGAPRKKPELNGFILGKYGLMKKDAVFVGDSLDDYEAAVPNGIPFIGRILKEKNNFEGLPGIKALIKDLTELERHV